MNKLLDPRRSLWTFEWLSKRVSYSFHDIPQARASLRDLAQYVGTPPPNDSLLTRTLRALDLLADLLAVKRKNSGVQMLIESHREMFERRREALGKHAEVSHRTDAELKRELRDAPQAQLAPVRDWVSKRAEGGDELATWYLGLMEEVSKN